MSGENVVKMPKTARSVKPEIITITPEMAIQLLEMNHNNRPLSDQHVMRIARQITGGKWIYNGDTIKVAENHDILDGQHRLFAVIEANKSIETVIVRGIKREAFATIDTTRRLRSGADVLALNGVQRYRGRVANALAWLLRWQRNCIESYRDPGNKIENSEIEDAFAAHPDMVHAVERMAPMRHVGNVTLLGFLYYVFAGRNLEMAERFATVLENPARTPATDPLFKFRAYLTHFDEKRKDPVETIALAFKAVNAIKAGKRMERLMWKRQGPKREMFPELKI